jgi:hypothetical protein
LHLRSYSNTCSALTLWGAIALAARARSLHSMRWLRRGNHIQMGAACRTCDQDQQSTHELRSGPTLREYRRPLHSSTAFASAPSSVMLRTIRNGMVACRMHGKRSTL